MKLSKVKELISEGLTDIALAQLEKEISANNIFYNEITILKSRLNQLNKDNRAGILSNESFTLERNKINSSTLSLLTKLNKFSKKGKKKKLLKLSGLILIFIITPGLYSYIKNKKKETHVVSPNAFKLMEDSHISQKEGFVPKGIEFNTTSSNDVITLIYLSHEYGVQDTFKISHGETVKTLKETIKRNYRITLDSNIVFSEASRILLANNKKLLFEEKSLKESGVNNNDVIRYGIEYIKLDWIDKFYVPQIRNNKE